jgi:putative peptidoglycan lipid II flippase
MTERDETRGDPLDTLRLAPGASLARGRYRLLTPHGGRSQLQFWQALDTASGREVALTLVDPDGALPEAFVHEILARTVRLKGIEMPGIARLLEVLHTGRFGVVASEWIYGGSLRQIADTAPSATGVASAMQSVAAATQVAHRAGLLLSIDDPSRLRISIDGHAALAFPATMPEASIQSDLRGIGAAMNALLVNRWSGEQFDSDQPPPDETDPGIPFLISTTISGLLRENGGIASAGTLLTLLRQATADVADAQGCSVMPPLTPPPPGYYAGFRNFGADERAAAARRQIMRVGVGTAALIVVVALLALASTLNRVLGNDHDAVAFDPDKLGLNTPTSRVAQPPPTQVLRKGAAAGERIQPVAAAVFSPDGSPDSPESAGSAIDGNPTTAWSTDTYYDADPFPKFKSGVGLVLQLAQPTAVSAVIVDLNSTGTFVQVRSAQNTTPKTLAETTELTAPTPTRPGRNRIAVSNAAPVSNVLVWIPTLGSVDGKSRSAISEIEIQAASPPA